jgi:hypothetical protein
MKLALIFYMISSAVQDIKFREQFSVRHIYLHKKAVALKPPSNNFMAL